ALLARPDHLLASRETAGRWTQHDWDWSRGDPLRYAIHMVLLRGDTTIHSRILYWSFDNSNTFLGGEWGWTKSNDGCDLDDASLHFDSLSVNTAGFDVFCGGHATLAEPGQSLLVAG